MQSKAYVSPNLDAGLKEVRKCAIRIVQGLAQEDQQDERFELQAANGDQAYLESVRYQARVAPMVDVLSRPSVLCVPRDIVRM